MKLNKWIFNKIKELDYLVNNTIPSEEDIEKWLLEYNDKKSRNKLPLEYKDETK